MTISTQAELKSTQQIYSTKEVAEFLRISRQTLYRIRLDGVLSFRRVGGRVVFTQQDLDEFLDRQKTQACRINT
jgi:excisionase family DNA binding protein